MRRTPPLAGFVAAGLLAFAAVCSPTVAASEAPTASSLTLPGRAAGSPVSLDKLRGRIVMLNFWASWCGPCREEFPLLDQMYKRYRAAGVTIVGVNVEPDSSDAEGFLAHTPVSFPIAFDRDSVASQRFRVDAMPTTVLIDRDGAVRWTHRGYKAGDENEYLDQIRSLLREKAP
jgi:thiol-disulfide isomerase/thioredoxin